MSSEYDAETDFDGLESNDGMPVAEDTPSPYQTEVEQIVDAHLSAMQADNAARQRQREYLKFGILAAILLGVVIIVALAQPMIFSRIVPAVMGGDEDTAVLNESNPPDVPPPNLNMTDGAATAVPQDNTQNLPIISAPGSNDTGTGGEGGGEEATAVPAQIYVVQQGDTLNSIARQFNTTVEAIVAANNIQNPDTLAVGVTLTIPQP